jgi:hypothetical protein
MKKYISIVFSIVLVFSIFMPSAIADKPNNVRGIRPLFTYISSVGNGLTISGGTASMNSHLTASGSANKIVMNSYLKRNQSGTWTTVDSWPQTTYSSSAYWSDTCSVSSGYYYKLVTYFYVYNGSTLLESTTVTSSQVYY